MYDSDDFKLGIYAIVIICFWIGLAVWGLWELIDWLWIEDAI